MAPLLQILGLSRSDDTPPRSRLTWHLRRHAETTSIPDIPDLTVHHSGSKRTSETTAESPVTVVHDEDVLADDDGSQHSGNASTIQETATGKSATSSLSRPRGSNPLKSIMTRFHRKSDKFNEQSESSEPNQSFRQPAEGEESELPARSGRPGHFSPLSRNPPSAGSEATEQQRTVSSQTAQSQGSDNTSATVHRHTSQRGIQAPHLELHQDCFSLDFFADYVPETSHFAEGSDPSTDRINMDITAAPPIACAPSKRSSKRSSATSSNQSSKHASKQSSKQPSHEQNHEGSSSLPPTSQPLPRSQSFFSSRHTSSASYASQTCRLDPLRAASGFNSLSGQYNLQITLDGKFSANIERKLI